mgnify:CR=1 FL=1
MRKNQSREYTPKRSRKKQKQKKRLLEASLMCMAMFFLGVLCGKLVFAKEDGVADSKVVLESIREPVTEDRVNINQGRISRENESEENWKLVLVNSSHFMEADYVPKLAEVEDGYYFDVRAVKDLQEMLKAGREEGMDFRVCSAYRTMEKQISLYDNKVSSLMCEEGINYEEACRQAGNTVAVPGTSEHQLGLAVDIVAKDYQILDEKQADTKEAKWLKEHCREYGFILRYPLDKTEETGIIFEPWHYRYVGVDIATYIHENNITFDEYYAYFLEG